MDVVERRLGLRWSDARARSITDDVRRSMDAAGIDDPAVYARRLEDDPAALDALAEQVRVGETFFLREPGQLRAVAERVLPALVSDGLPDGRPLRVWSAACASGEETYTLAIVLETAGLAGKADVLGTDRSAEAIAAAERGEYRRWALRAVDDSLRGRWFVPTADGRRWHVVQRLRSAVTFQQHDLLVDPYPAGQDLVVCRNVLMYLTRAHGEMVVERLARSLAPGGWLVLGSADPHHLAGNLLESVRTSAGMLYHRPEPKPTAVPAREDMLVERPRPARADPVAGDEVPSAADEADVVSRSEQDLAERPLDPELHARHAMLLLERGQAGQALQAATAALFLAPDLAGAHVVLGRAHLAMGDTARAVRAFRNARALLVSLPADAPVPPWGTTAERLLEVVRVAQGRLAGSSTP